MPQPPKTIITICCYVLLNTSSIATELDQYQRHYNAYLQPERYIKIYPTVSGYVKNLTVRLGDRVKKGDLLFQIDDKYRQLTIRKAKIHLKQQRYQYQQTLHLQAKQAISDAQKQADETALSIAQIELDRLIMQEQDSYVYAPINGLISWQQIENLDWLKPHQHVLSLFDPNKLRLIAEIDNDLLQQLKIKQNVHIYNIFSPIPSAWIQHIYPEITPQTQQGKIEIKLSFVPKNWHSGQVITVQFDSAPNQ